MTLCRQIVDLLGSYLSDKTTQTAEVRHIAVVQMQLVSVLVICTRSSEDQRFA